MPFLALALEEPFGFQGAPTSLLVRSSDLVGALGRNQGTAEPAASRLGFEDPHGAGMASVARPLAQLHSPALSLI